MKVSIVTDQVPAAFGPYSQAVNANNMLFVSGQLGIDPKDGRMPVSVEEQAGLAMKNLEGILSQAGYSFDDVVKTTIFLADLANFAAVNEIYGAYFKDVKPARSCIQVAAIPKGAAIEIELIAVK